jgi:hypothetical protein
MTNDYLDLSGCGIGNIVLFTAAFSELCIQEDTCPVIYHPEPETLGVIIDTSLFDVVSERPDGATPFDPSRVCNVVWLFRSVGTMRALVMVPESLPDLGAVKAGFCIRVSDPRHDGDVRFMNDVAIATMKEEMKKYTRVLVCSNDRAFLEDLPSNAVVVDYTDPTVRNTTSHMVQWHCLARCPIIYHGVATASDTSVTSTFGATAGVYGGSTLVGVDNTGAIVTGHSYHW